MRPNDRAAAEKLLVLRAEQARRAARSNFLPFVRYTKPDYLVNWHHRLICSKLDRWLAGEFQNLLIMTPPQEGKSELVSRRLPARILGLDPRAKVAITSYSAARASALNRDVQRIVADPLYADIYPELRIGNGLALNNDFFETQGPQGGEPGGVMSTGVGGSLTGFTIDYGIIDDPIKDHAEAHSPTFRARLWEWYSSVFRTRLHNNSQTLLTLTRWHEDDLAGRILASSEASSWEVLLLPAIAEGELDPEDPRAQGEPLWAARHSLESLLEAKERNPGVFSALYQQRPSPPEGTILLPKWFRRFSELDPPARRVLSVDATFKGEGRGSGSVDFVAAQVWQQDESGNIQACELHRERAGFTRTIEIIRELAERWNPEAILIEDKANGSAIIEVLSREFLQIVPVEPQGGKVARAFAAQPILEGGRVGMPRVASWVESFLEECRAFPNGAHDDQIDAFTQAITYLGRGAGVWSANIRI